MREQHAQSSWRQEFPWEGHGSCKIFNAASRRGRAPVCPGGYSRDPRLDSSMFKSDASAQPNNDESSGKGLTRCGSSWWGKNTDAPTSESVLGLHASPNELGRRSATFKDGNLRSHLIGASI